MRRAFISDLHLDQKNEDRFLRFQEFLNVESDRLDEIYILGDLVESWIGDDDDSEFAKKLKETIRGASQKSALFIMHGNRDFLIGSAFCSETGVTLIPDSTRLAEGLLLAHGDCYCIDDHDYQEMKSLLRSDDWQKEFLSQSLQTRREFSKRIRKESQASNATKAEGIMDVSTSAIEDVKKRNDITIVIHGHTHRPGIEKHDDGFTRITLGPWERCGWVCYQNDFEFKLSCFNLQDRYEIEILDRLV